MTELILGGTILLLAGLLFYEKQEGKHERQELVNALVAKSVNDFRDLKLADKVKPIEPPERIEPNLIPEGDLSDQEFKQIIEKETNG